MSGEIDRQQMFDDLLERVRNEGVNTKEQYVSLVDIKVDELLEWGQISDDADTKGLRAELVGRWDDIQAQV